MSIIELTTDNLERLKSEFHDSGAPWPIFQRAANTKWILHNYPLGLLLVANGKLVGWIQTIFSTKEQEATCNLSTWFVDPDYRHLSLNLMLYIKRKFKEIPITVFSASGKAEKIYHALKVPILETTRWLYKPRKTPVVCSRVNTFEQVITPDKDIENTLYDHFSHGISVYKIEKRDEYCYFLTRERDWKNKVVNDVLGILGTEALFFNGFSFDPYSEVGNLLVDQRFIPKQILKFLIDNKYLEEFNPTTNRFVINPAGGKRYDFLYSEIVLNDSNLL